MSEKVKTNFILSILKAVGAAVIITLVSVLLFGVIVKFTSLNLKVIKVVNQFIKVTSVFLGCFIFVKESKGLVKGLITGLLFTVVTYLIFAIIGKGVSFGVSFLIDLAFSLVIGGVAGIISVNAKKR